MTMETRLIEFALSRGFKKHDLRNKRIVAFLESSMEYSLYKLSATFVVAAKAISMAYEAAIKERTKAIDDH
jgi:hypothetical protein